jgi:peptidoglycan/LPS O-acetylase OafA/YrhL
LKLSKGVLSEESSVFLNLVRLIACEMVVLGHFLTKYQPTPYDALFIFGSTLGGAAVLIFFALSGLLVSYSLVRKTEDPQYGFRCYFVDRFSRIYSGLIPALILSAVVAGVIYTSNYAYFTELSSMQSAPSLQNFTLTFFMLERFPVGFFTGIFSTLGLRLPLPEVTPFGFNGILWTLVVEWWVYMFFGALVIGSLALAGRRRKSVGYKSVFCVAITLLGLLLVGFCGEFGSSIVVWFAGALMTVALGSQTVKSRFSGDKGTGTALALLIAGLVAAGFGLYVAFTFTHDFYSLYLGLALSLCLFLAILLLNTGKTHVSRVYRHKRAERAIALGAGYSYTLFLTHYPIIILLNGLDLPVDPWIMLLPILLITNLLAFVIAHFTEQRSRQLAAIIKKSVGLPN